MALQVPKDLKEWLSFWVGVAATTWFSHWLFEINWWFAGFISFLFFQRMVSDRLTSKRLDEHWTRLVKVENEVQRKVAELENALHNVDDFLAGRYKQKMTQQYSPTWVKARWE